MITIQGGSGAPHNGRGSKTKTKGPMETLKELYEGDLKDLYWAENHLIKVLPKMAKAADSEELATAFTHHLSQAHTHVSRLIKVFAASGLEVGSTKCEAMDGLTKEGVEVIQEHAKGRVRDAGLIIAAHKVEHYEITAYGSLRALAEVMGFDKAAGTLQETLDEEVATDKRLSVLAETINLEALAVAEEED